MDNRPNHNYPPKMKRYLSPFLLTIGLCSWFIGCASIEPGEDPLVIRCEQLEYTAKANFDLILNVNNLDRGFWRTNSPQFHNFCEWLRQPQVVWITNTLPRASAMIANLDAIKNTYKMNKSASNDVITVLATLQAFAEQAGSWAGVVTNQVFP